MLKGYQVDPMGLVQLRKIKADVAIAEYHAELLLLNDTDTTGNINSDVPKENKAKALCTRFYLSFMIFLVHIQLET